ncbi:MAG: (deoxy)nucleoside triphosphate pyrophosphohydrolase [Pseudomonadota bacterium]
MSVVNENMLPIVYVVAGVFQNKKREILLIQRPKDKPMPGLWEFPGGKIEKGETPEEALIRELKEEIALTPLNIKPLSFVSHTYDTFHIILLPYLVTEWEGTFDLLEHQQGYMWVMLEDMHNFSKPTASQKVIEYIFSKSGVKPKESTLKENFSEMDCSLECVQR